METQCPRCGDEIGEDRTILVAVLDKAFGRLLAEILSAAGMKVVPAEEPREIFSLLESAHPRVAVLDVRLPRLLGLDVPEIIRRSPRFRDVRIVDVSGSGVPHSQGKLETTPPDRSSGSVRAEDMGGDVRAGLNPEEEILHQEARKLARIIVSDIVLYNPEKVEEGVRQGTFFPLLKEDIEEGRRFYQERISASVIAVRDYYEEALAEYLEKKSKSAFSRSF